MALVNCPECGKEISDKAKKCIHCGYPIQNTETDRKSNRKVIVAVVIIIILGSVGISSTWVYKNIFLTNKTYKVAQALLKDGKFDEAISKFELLDDYKDSKQYLLKCYYEKGVYLMEKKDYNNAIIAFESSNQFSDASSQIELAKKIIEDEKIEQRLKELKDTLKAAYNQCDSPHSKLAADGKSLYVDSEDKYDAAALIDIMTICVYLKLPDSLYTEMLGTNSLMGKQKKIIGDYEVSWSYHPDNGLDVLFEIIEK